MAVLDLVAVETLRAQRSHEHIAIAQEKLRGGTAPLLAIEYDLIVGCFGENQLGWPIRFHKYFEPQNERNLFFNTERMVQLAEDATPTLFPVLDYRKSGWCELRDHQTQSSVIRTPNLGIMPVALAFALASAIRMGY